jgi:hypothetical protein
MVPNPSSSPLHPSIFRAQAVLPSTTADITKLWAAATPATAQNRLQQSHSSLELEPELQAAALPSADADEPRDLSLSSPPDVATPPILKPIRRRP